MMLMLIQIQRWLMQPEVWRFVGSASTIVGLLCYALSSSFNHLFGEWNLLKILLYSVFSIIICLAILFAKVWQHSTSLRFKAHLAFLVLAITSVYSFFFDKAEKGKPDAYSLISCAAFAIMSLSLSRQTHCGFEVDLLYFFLGSLIVQLMKINWLLAIGGAGFNYFLIILRSSLDAPLVTGYLLLQDHVIIQVDSQQANTGSALVVTPQQANAASIMTLDASPENGDQGLQDHVIAQVDSHSQQVNSDSALIMPQIMAACIKALKKKNQKLIRVLSIHVEGYLKANVDFKYNSLPGNLRQQIDPILLIDPNLVIDPNLIIDALPSKIVNDLHETVKLMMAAGFEKECCHVYSSCRREFLQQCLSRFDLPELNIEDVDNKDRLLWIKVINVTVHLLLPNEKRLCDRVFFGFLSAAELSFVEACRELMVHLMNSANTFAIGRCSPNLLLSNLKVLETLRGMIPEFGSLFSDEYSASIRNEAHTIWKRLGEAIWGIFMELENLIRNDTVQAPIPSGGIHPLTYQVTDCLRGVFLARDALEQALSGREGTSSLSIQVASTIELLERNLEANSKSYADPALGSIFMMNNGVYIQQRNIQPFVARGEWFQKYAAKVRQNLEQHQRNSWDKVLDLLKLDNYESLASNVAAELMKEKLNLFNMYFKEICTVQSTWFTIDEQVRKEIRISLENILLPAYGKFVGRFQDVLGKQADEYIQYGIFDIQAQLDRLFRGGKRMKGY